jgi:hypothetical protein
LAEPPLRLLRLDRTVDAALVELADARGQSPEQTAAMLVISGLIEWQRWQERELRVAQLEDALGLIRAEAQRLPLDGDLALERLAAIRTLTDGVR